MTTGTGRSIVVAVGSGTGVSGRWPPSWARMSSAATRCTTASRSPLAIGAADRRRWRHRDRRGSPATAPAIAPARRLGTVAIAAVPEGLPLLASVAEAAVARRLARRALVTRLAAVEALRPRGRSLCGQDRDPHRGATGRQRHRHRVRSARVARQPLRGHASRAPERGAGQPTPGRARREIPSDRCGGHRSGAGRRPGDPRGQAARGGVPVRPGQRLPRRRVCRRAPRQGRRGGDRAALQPRAHSRRRGAA